LAPIRAGMPPNYTWAQLINKALNSGVDLTSRKRVAIPGTTPFGYYANGAAVAEVIADILTGETQITRADILYDCGQSTNSLVDIGQAEGK
jgi:xanthine dehydrogenase molybdopterin-binding subunit B